MRQPTMLKPTARIFGVRDEILPVVIEGFQKAPGEGGTGLGEGVPATPLSRCRNIAMKLPIPVGTSDRKELVSTKQANALLILIAGPYRSGTNDDPALLRKNVEEMESYALPIFRAGHIPILGEWLALPLVHLCGSTRVGDECFNEIFHPIAVRLLEKCDAVLRVGGASIGADEMVRVGRSLGLAIYMSLAEIPKVA